MPSKPNAFPTRRIVQAAFLGVTLAGVFVVRGNAERWCPFGGVEALYTYWTDGNLICSLDVSNFYALIGLLVSVLVLRRAFCGYLCPIGTVSEWLSRLSRRLGLRPVRVPPTADRVLSLLKYGVLGVVLYATWRAGELLFRGWDPCYALLSRHGEDITAWAYVVSAAIVVGSLAVAVPFCRWLCPLAAAVNPLSRFGLARVKRDAGACTACGACSAACPMAIPVGELREVKAARCTSCLDCIAACAASGRGALAWGPPARRWPRAALVGLLGVIVAAVVATSCALPLASFAREHRPGQRPATVAPLDLRVRGVTCRGTAQLLTYFLFRDDVSEVPGYLKLEAWPGEGFARVRVAYDPQRAGPDAIKAAIVEPYFDRFQGFERLSPFEIEGYAPWTAGGPKPSSKGDQR